MISSHQKALVVLTSFFGKKTMGSIFSLRKSLGIKTVDISEKAWIFGVGLVIVCLLVL